MPKPEQTISAYFQAIRQKDADAWVACFAPDAVAQDPAHAEPRQGTEAHQAFFSGFAGLFAELDFREDTPHVCGNRAAVAFTARCVAPDGRSAMVAGIDVFRFDAGGRIQHVDGYWDPSPLLVLAG